MSGPALLTQHTAGETCVGVCSRITAVSRVNAETSTTAPVMQRSVLCTIVHDSFICLSLLFVVLETETRALYGVGSWSATLQLSNIFVQWAVQQAY